MVSIFWGFFVFLEDVDCSWFVDTDSLKGLFRIFLCEDEGFSTVDFVPGSGKGNLLKVGANDLVYLVSDFEYLIILKKFEYAQHTRFFLAFNTTTHRHPKEFEPIPDRAKYTISNID